MTRYTHPTPARLTLRRCQEQGRCKCAERPYRGEWMRINRRLCLDKYRKAIAEIVQRQWEKIDAR